MPVDRHLWWRNIGKGQVPAWQCPVCEKGILIEEASAEVRKTPTHIADNLNSQDFDPHDSYDQFFRVANCQNQMCGEPVLLVGNTEWTEMYDADYGPSLSETYRIRAVHPPLKMFAVAKGVPHGIKREINRAFKVYWTDNHSCAAALRAAVERLLDHLQVPKQTKKKKWMSLASRIEVFGETSPDEKDSLHALRIVGNLGAHGTEVSEENVLDAMEVLEHALEEILEIRAKRVKALRQKLLELQKTSS